MTVVLPFPQNRVSPRETVATSQTAEIIIFPGVRIERRNFDLAATRAPARKRRATQTAIDEDALTLT
jgi:hypothetical protein